MGDDDGARRLFPCGRAFWGRLRVTKERFGGLPGGGPQAFRLPLFIPRTLWPGG